MTGRSKRKKSKASPKTEKNKEDKKPEQEKVAPPPAKIPKSDSPPIQAESPPAVSRPPRGPQCFNCQRWGHRSFNCQFDTRCVKCGQAHRASDCQKKREDPPTCALCAGPHPASYRGCKLAPKTRRRRRPQPRRSQPEPSEKGPLKKLLEVMCKLLIRKDFFTEAQLAVIQNEMDEKPATSEASTQTVENAVCQDEIKETGKAEEMPQPLPMETSSAPPTQFNPELQAPPTVPETVHSTDPGPSRTKTYSIYQHPSENPDLSPDDLTLIKMYNDFGAMTTNVDEFLDLMRRIPDNLVDHITRPEFIVQHLLEKSDR